ncbi:MAG TPA: phosphate-starvation-inducible PsiE family protein [Actinomycetota bacterium]|jgi:uncharacterized membrane protein (DUF373 family)|nr:phosphate-starvation-inducible PsiE family protein [Actinomycetota bacterium]
MPRDSKETERQTDRWIRLAEDAIYLSVAGLLIIGGLILLGKAGYDLFTKISEGVEEAIKQSLNTLLLVFIVVELLSAVKTTIVERKLLAEPFLLVGMIASIKEIILVTTEVEFRVRGEQFERGMIELGLLGGLVLALSVATLMLRRKEREPRE